MVSPHTFGPDVRKWFQVLLKRSRIWDTLHVRYTKDGITGYGEGSPIVRYHENAVDAQKAIEGVRDFLLNADPWQFRKNTATLFQRVENQFAAKSAIDIAWMDWVGKRLGLPFFRFLGVDPKDTPVTTFSIGIGAPEITRQKTREAEDFPVLKVKVGLSTDEATIEAVRSVTKKPLRVDANEGWKDKEEAVRKINWLESQGEERVLADFRCCGHWNDCAL